MSDFQILNNETLEPVANENGDGRLNVDEAVHGRYAAAAQAAEPALCCPVQYDASYLEVLPQELIERDYGCGDPSRFVQAGDTVLDLGSGGGKICYIASQIVGAKGCVIGVDRNDEMLELARKFQQQIGDAVGYHNTEFRKGRIQDLALDLDAFESHLAKNPIRDSEAWMEAQRRAEAMRLESPMIADDSIDVILSNCVLNLVSEEDRRQLWSEMFRVLRRGGRAVISDIVSDEVVPDDLKNDAKLWSGCISGALEEKRFLEMFEEAGFYGVEILDRQEEAWATVRGIEFRSLTVRAFKGKEGPCLDHHQAVIYNGPWKSVTDDDGHVLRRGVRTAVCEKTFDIYTKTPYADAVTAIAPHVEVKPEQAKEFRCRPAAERSPRETKGDGYGATELPGGGDCGPTCC